MNALHSLRRSASRFEPRRGGAVIIVVLALMAMLAFLGLFFYDFVQIEANTAENFSQTTDPLAGIDVESLASDAMKSVIVHPDQAAVDRGSVLDGGKATLLSHVLGTIAKNGSGNYTPRDYVFRNGRGIRLVPGTPPQFVYTGNDADVAGGTFPLTDAALILNRSAAANPTRLDDTTYNYEPDVGYTYPDLNSIFLAAEYLQLIDTNNNGIQDAGEELVRVIKPSFMDPDVFLALQGNTGQWYQSAATKRWMFRPHAAHTIPGSATPRFLSGQFPKIDGTPLNLGPWTGAPNSKDWSGLDADADADGVFDSIYLDLGLSPVQLADGSGRTLIPLTFWKIEDLNGLIDLNAAGNIADIIYKNRTSTVDLVNDIYQPTATPVLPIHYSHYGLSRAEINPMWALWASPPSAVDGRTRWDVAFYRNTANPTFTQIQLQNTELAMLLMGSSVSMEQSIANGHNFGDGLDDLEGRFGDRNRILTTPTGQYSAPGNLGIDEDEGTDTNENGMLDGGESTAPLANRVINGYSRPRGVHPTDSFGTGSVPISTSAGGARQLAVLPGGQIRFPTYTGRWQSQPPYVTQPTYTQSLAGSPLLTEVQDLRPDDPGEVNRYSYANTDLDNLFRPSETAALHLSDYDYTRAAMFSRIRQLAPFNFNMSANSREIRRQFTTESWDRREFAFPFDGNRSFEFNDVDGANYRFPPSFGGVASRHETGSIVDSDPFRPEVRRLLTTFSVRNSPPPDPNRVYFPQLPLELNRILEDRPGGTAAFDSLGNPNFRPLTPHPYLRDPSLTPTDMEPTMWHGNDPAAFPTVMTVGTPPGTHPIQQFNARLSNKFVQEWWARYDRQRVARDIYVLLVTLCSPDGTAIALRGEDANGNGRLDGSEDANGNGVLDSPLVEMAQFAVNYVDAMDEDDVITKFEFDTDFATGGWNPVAGTAPTVYGVEAQKLSISEVLWIKQDNTDAGGMGDNVQRTLHDESTGHHQWMYIELRNNTPFNVDFQPNTWRIVRLDPTFVTANPNLNPATDGHLASVTFKSPTRFVAPGANFVISSHDGTLQYNSGVMVSDYYAKVEDTNMDDYEAIVPAGAPSVLDGAILTPQCDLDLCYPDPSHSDHYDLSPIASGTKMLYYSADTADTETRLILSLQRRPNLWTGTNVSNLGNDEWVEVDRFNIEDVGTLAGGNKFVPPSGTDLAPFVAVIDKIQSNERYHPLDDRGTRSPIPTPAPATVANHTVKRPNSTDLNGVANGSDGSMDMPFVYNSVWQPHHDRELTSVYELLSVPVCGPDKLLSRLRDHAASARFAGQVNGWGNSAAGIPYAAMVRFDPRVVAAPSASVIPWTRLLNFLTLPDPTDRVQRKVNQNFVRSRTFGQINVNTIRSAHVLEGLLDDPRIITSNTPFLTDTMTTNRFWWNSFKRLRDGSPTQRMAGRFSRPFLPPGQFHSDNTRPVDAVEHSLLRHAYTVYPPDASEAQFGVLEARTPTDFDADTTNGEHIVDVHTRSRLLQKLANNASTRSHMFAIWGGIDFFEGTASGSSFQVGAKVSDVQTCRWFYIVDMSRLEEAYDARTKSFDWRKFIVYRQRLE